MCGTKADEFKVRQADAAAEVGAITEAIGMLSNDDALELMNKTREVGRYTAVDVFVFSRHFVRKTEK